MFHVEHGAMASNRQAHQRINTTIGIHPRLGGGGGGSGCCGGVGRRLFLGPLTGGQVEGADGDAREVLGSRLHAAHEAVHEVQRRQQDAGRQVEPDLEAAQDVRRPVPHRARDLAALLDVATTTVRHVSITASFSCCIHSIRDSIVVGPQWRQTSFSVCQRSS